MSVYIAIEKSVERFEKYKALWKKRGRNGIWAATMIDGIKAAIHLAKSNTDELYFISIVASDMTDFIEKLSILSEETAAPILVATENYTEEEHHEALRKGADFYDRFCETPEQDLDGVMSAIEAIKRNKKRKFGQIHWLTAGF